MIKNKEKKNNFIANVQQDKDVGSAYCLSCKT